MSQGQDQSILKQIAYTFRLVNLIASKTRNRDVMKQDCKKMLEKVVDCAPRLQQKKLINFADPD